MPKPTISKNKLFERIGYNPFPEQRLFHDSTARFKILCTGARFGKSYCAVKEILPYILTPNTRGWMVGPTYSLVEKEYRYLCEDVFEKLHLTPRKFNDDAKTGRMFMEMDWGATCEGKSAERAHTLLGEELDWLILCEGSQLDKTVWERFLRARLTSRGGVCIIPTTPAGEDDFLYPLWKKGQDPKNHHEFESWEFPTWANPGIPKSEIESLRETMSPEVFQEQVEGKFVKYAGLVYPEFDTNVHRVKPFDIPREWRREAGLDFGFRNPCGFVAGAFDYDGNCYIYDEIYETKLLMAGLASKIREKSMNADGTTFEFERIWGDRSAAALIAELAEHDIMVTPADNEIVSGIERVRSRLLIDPKTKKPRLYIFENCVNLINEFRAYHYPKDRASGDANEIPEKHRDHLCDGLRYMFAGRGDATEKHEIEVIDEHSYQATLDQIKDNEAYTGNIGNKFWTRR